MNQHKILVSDDEDLDDPTHQLNGKFIEFYSKTAKCLVGIPFYLMIAVRILRIQGFEALEGVLLF